MVNISDKDLESAACCVEDCSFLKIRVRTENSPQVEVLFEDDDCQEMFDDDVC